MKLYLVQHGEALAKDVDPDRPLSDAGRSAVSAVGARLAASGLRVGAIMHSGKTRAEQTAALLAERLAAERPIEPRAGLNPNDPVAPLAAEAAAWHEDRMLVGHLPFMAKLAGLLIGGGDSPDLVLFTPGSVLCLERSDGGRWHIAWMLRPELLAGSSNLERGHG